MPKIFLKPPKLLKKKNYQAMVMNLVRGGSVWLFKNLYVKPADEPETDLLMNGKRACAVVESGVLLLNGLIKGMHATVNSTEKDMLASGWTELQPPKDWLNTDWKDIKPLLKDKIGAIIVWENQIDKEDGFGYNHIGFYADDDFAISNDSHLGVPAKHHITWGAPGMAGFRRIEKIYWHPLLDAE